MSQHPMKDLEDKQFEARAQARAKNMFTDEDRKGVRYFGVENDPKVEAFNQAMKAERRRKVN
jgi:hypothetical protein